ncbi:hypothetical protein IE81DRAFT_317176 [Ceraceosorus guamensis]|uniref:DHH phosphoesterase n=1 Tax=Ceraceosorus guamensis TaxID=1522189 RepID=A0A316VX30_9BASI|nr:hypothetical protein IE81DRAFT_317176 [Ceraceosorus guamensis]PWN40025.1 hypothetical protein IE81DRAFT_317176 [Ceraceosorus guamensis]
MKNKAESSESEASRKRARLLASSSTTTTTTTTTDRISLSRPHPDGSHLAWPVPQSDLERARAFIKRMADCAMAEDERGREAEREGERERGERERDSRESLGSAGASTPTILIVPDKDADGLASGCILHRTLLAMGVPASRIAIHHVSRAGHPGTSQERRAMSEKRARWIVVLDQGSRAGDELVDGSAAGWQWEERIDAQEQNERDRRQGRARCAVFDHHHLGEGGAGAGGGPKGSLMINASSYEPVATSALLTWVICRPLWYALQDCCTEERIVRSIDWLAVLGTCGDLSVNVKWDAPFPALDALLSRYGKKRVGDTISAINAPRRTPSFNVSAAYAALFEASDLTGVLASPHAEHLHRCRRAVAQETERCTHTAPKFSKDGRVALLFIHSAYQVHPSIATRWSGTLKGAKKLQAVYCANTGYYSNQDRLVHFSGRIAKAAKDRGEEPSLIELLHSYASLDHTFLPDLCKHYDVPSASHLSFARGHKQASGGILPHAFWHRFVKLMQIGEKPEAKESPKREANKQKNKLTNYFGAQQT